MQTHSFRLNHDINELLSDDEIDHRIVYERNKSIHEISQDVEHISEIMSDLSLLVQEQGEVIDTMEQQVENSVLATTEGTKSLERAALYIKDRGIILRDIAIVAAGGILGTTGFLLGPIIGVGTIIAGVAGGSAAVAGIHKVEKININTDNSKPAKTIN